MVLKFCFTLDSPKTLKIPRLSLHLKQWIRTSRSGHQCFKDSLGNSNHSRRRSCFKGRWRRALSCVLYLRGPHFPWWILSGFRSETSRLSLISGKSLPSAVQLQENMATTAGLVQRMLGSSIMAKGQSVSEAPSRRWWMQLFHSSSGRGQVRANRVTFNLQIGISITPELGQDGSRRGSQALFRA